MAFSLVKNVGLLKNQGISSEFLSFAAALSKGSFGQCRSSSTAPVPQETGKNLLGSDVEGKYSPFQVSLLLQGLGRENIGIYCLKFMPMKFS